MRLVVAKRTVGSFSTIPFLTPVAEERTAGFARDDGFIHFEKTHPLEALDSLKCLTEPRAKFSCTESVRSQVAETQRARCHLERREKSFLDSSHSFWMTIRCNVTLACPSTSSGHALRPFDAAQDMLCASHLFSEPGWLSVHPPVDVDLVAFVL